MKIISGFLKGRIVEGYKIEGTRPTMDRVKESIFSMIQLYIKDSIVLDLFSGSGNYGIEAISNYAKFVYFNDKNKECVKCIQKHLDKFNIKDKCLVFQSDYLECLSDFKKKDEKIDIIFLDPPYKLLVVGDILSFIAKNNLLNNKGIVVCEIQGDKLEDRYLNLEKIKYKKYGEKEVYIYQKKGD